MRKYNDYTHIDVIDTIFTKEKILEWKKHIVASYENVLHRFKKELDPINHIQFFLNESLLDEVLIDAVIGMKKITDSKFNAVESPNAFKIAAYIAYWWLRHKPVSLHFNEGFRLEEATIVKTEKIDNEAYNEGCKKIRWRLKHVNELVAVHIVMTYIFNFENQLCKEKQCKQIKNMDNNSFPLQNFEQMEKIFSDKLLYYFSYRALAPKIIEQILEAATFHPAWALTGSQWGSEEMNINP